MSSSLSLFLAWVSLFVAIVVRWMAGVDAIVRFGRGVSSGSSAWEVTEVRIATECPATSVLSEVVVGSGDGALDVVLNEVQVVWTLAVPCLREMTT